MLARRNCEVENVKKKILMDLNETHLNLKKKNAGSTEPHITRLAKPDMSSGQILISFVNYLNVTVGEAGLATPSVNNNSIFDRCYGVAYSDFHNFSDSGEEEFFK